MITSPRDPNPRESNPKDLYPRDLNPRDPNFREPKSLGARSQFPREKYIRQGFHYAPATSISEPLNFPEIQHNISAPSCDHFSHHGEWKNIWRLKFWQKPRISNPLIERETYLKTYQ